MAEAVATTAVAPGVAARDTAVPARADPAVLSARKGGNDDGPLYGHDLSMASTEVSGLAERFAGSSDTSVHVWLSSVLGCFMH